MERKLKTYFISVGKLETGQVVIFTAPGWDPDQSGAPSASGRRGSWWEFYIPLFCLFMFMLNINTSWSRRPFRTCFSWQQVETVVLKVFVKLMGCQELWPLYRFRDTNDFLSIFLCLWFYQQNFPPKVFKSCFVDKNLNEPPKGKVLKETSGSISISNIFDGFVWNDWCEATRYNTLSINISWWAFINICTYKPLNKLYPFGKNKYYSIL